MTEENTLTLTPRTRGALPPERFALLDGLRFAAAFAIVAFHFVARETTAWAVPISEQAPAVFGVTKYGFFGVNLFFVISGFVILMSSMGRPLHHFVASRVARLYPGYWASVLLTFVVLALATEPHPGIAQLLANLTMFQEPMGAPHLDGVYWTMWVEMRFYILIGLLLLIGMTDARLLAVATLWPIVAVFAQASGAHFLADLLIWQHASLFAGGMLLFMIARQGPRIETVLPMMLNVALAVWIDGRGAAGSIKATTGAGIPEIAQWGGILLCFTLVAVVTLTPLRRVTWRWLTTLGALTFPLYLLHERIGWEVIRRLDWVSWPLAVSAATVVSIALAALVHFAIERPFGKPLRARLQQSLGSSAWQSVQGKRARGAE